jgi:hypothetical protein
LVFFFWARGTLVEILYHIGERGGKAKFCILSKKVLTKWQNMTLMLLFRQMSNCVYVTKGLLFTHCTLHYSVIIGLCQHNKMPVEWEEQIRNIRVK